MSLFLQPLAAAFRMGVAVRRAGYRRGWFKTGQLKRPVVSVGNLTVGGTGKTPLVANIAGILLRRGFKPGVLTRGYGRTSKDKMIIVEPGTGRHSSAQDIGDEPALLARALPELNLVICADRLRGGQVAEDLCHVDAHVLDDGFQHWALARDLDVVALDATQPLSDWRLLPAGRQREPISALRRAQIVVLTRTDSADPRPLEKLVVRAHPAAKLFRSRTELLGWNDALTGEAAPIEELRIQKVAAFCGLGNPQAFFSDLRRWGFDLVGEDAFPDHHVYTVDDLQRLATDARKKGAATLLTTQKDAVKIPGDWNPPLPILACKIEAQIVDAEEFERTLLTFLEKAR